MVRTRIAPSPTGYPHIGTIYQALFDFTYAKKHKGQFIVRIEDTDKERFVEGAEEKIYEALDWFGLTEDESSRKGGSYSSYRQSERLEIYQKYAKELIKRGGAYYCFCSKERLEKLHQELQRKGKPLMYDKCCRDVSPNEIQEKIKSGQEWVIRLKVPQNKKIVVKDEIRGEITFDSNLIDDQILIKSNGYPTYHLAATIDDHLMKITHVVRGEEWLSSSPKHFLIYDYFGWEKPLFFHTADLRNPDKSKLSKRHGHTNVTWYQEEGFLPQVLLNFLALMGWSHPEGKEIFPLSEFIRLFDLKDIKPVGPVFDLKKLEWMNGIYIRQQNLDQLAKIIKDYLLKYKNIKIEKENEEMFQKIVALAKDRMNTLSGFVVLSNHFFTEPNLKLKNEKELTIANDLTQSLEKLENWTKEEIFKTLKEVMEKNNVRMPVLYAILTGNDRGLPLPESLEILKKERVLKRLKSLQ